MLQKIVSLLLMFSSVSGATSVLAPVPARAQAEGATIKSLTNPIEVGENRVEIRLTRPDGKPVIGARFKLLASMPPMGTMPYMESEGEVEEKGKGVYVGTYELTMGGTWDLVITQQPGGKKWHYAVTTGTAGFTERGSGAGSTEEATPSLSLSPARLQRMGVRLGAVGRETLSRTVRAVGVAEPDPVRRREVLARFPAYVEKASPKRVGDPVRAGETLASLSSPELEAAQSEYLIAKRLGTTAHTLGPAEERLKNLGMSAADIDKLKRTEKPLSVFTITAPIAGTLLETNVRTGSRVDPGAPLFIVGDLARTFVVAKVFQRDAGLVRAGMSATLSIPEEGNAPIPARVDFVLPNTGEGTGITSVRLVPTSPTAALKPGVPVDVRIPITVGEGIVIPEDSVLNSGNHSYVFVEKTPGQLEARPVELGRRGGDKVLVSKGLQEGERIAISGTFLLSSEANLRSALPKWKNEK